VCEPCDVAQLRFRCCIELPRTFRDAAPVPAVLNLCPLGWVTTSEVLPVHSGMHLRVDAPSPGVLRQRACNYHQEEIRQSSRRALAADRKMRAHPLEHHCRSRCIGLALLSGQWWV
jgi:hypothetical protein